MLALVAPLVADGHTPTSCRLMQLGTNNDLNSFAKDFGKNMCAFQEPNTRHPVAGEAESGRRKSHLRLLLLRTRQLCAETLYFKFVGRVSDITITLQTQSFRSWQFFRLAPTYQCNFKHLPPSSRRPLIYLRCILAVNYGLI